MNTTDFRLNHSTTQNKYQASTNTSVKSFPTRNSNQLQKQQKKKKIRKYENSKQLKPITTSSPLRHDLSSTIKTNGNALEQKNEFAVVSNVSQD